MKCINRQAVGQLSSFFPAKRDEAAKTEDHEYLRMQRNGVTVEALNFPATQSILWNRTAQGGTETLHLTTKRNIRLYINEKTLRLAHRHINQTKSSFECFLVGSISVDSREDSIDVTVDRFDPGREVLVNNGKAKVKRKVPTTVVPGDHIVPVTLIQGLSGADSSVTHTTEELQKAFQVLFGRISSQEPINLSHLVSLKISCHSHADDDEIIINVNCGAITMATRIQATPVAAVPIIPTALARNLSGPLRLSEVQGVPKSGYLTMDHTRKLLLLLESDPKAFSLPLLGIWVSGIYGIHHPFIWACCLRFIYSTAIQQRVLAPPNSFLLLLYSPVKSTPEFWECQQDQGLSEMKVFEFYSCYENLHLEIPPGPSSSNPLCFELFLAPQGMGRSLFEQAVESWGKEHKQARFNQDGIPSSQNQVSTSLGQGLGEEEPSPLPRPSPSPHPQNLQFALPDVAETSLSLSFDEQSPGEHLKQGYANQQFLPHPRLKSKQQTKPHGQPQQQIQHEQENGQMRLQKEVSPGFVNGKEHLKQVRNNGAPQSSPSREPLKQILAPNHEKVMNQKQKQLSQKPHPMQGSVVQRVPNRRRSSPSDNVLERRPKVISDHSVPRPKGNGRQQPGKGLNVVHGTGLRTDQQKLKMRTKLQDRESVDKRAPPKHMILSDHHDGENRVTQVHWEQSVRPSNHQELNSNRFPLPVNQMQRPPLETVFEGETPDGTLNKSMDETELERHITGLSQSPQSPLGILQSQMGAGNRDSEPGSVESAGVILDQKQEQGGHGHIQTQINTENRKDRFIYPAVCESNSNKERVDNSAEHANKERLGCSADLIPKERLDNDADHNMVSHASNGSEQWQIHVRESQPSKSTGENTNGRRHEGTLPTNEQVSEVVTGQQAGEVARPDPYQLLIKQEAQLRQLQEQIKLLLQQQNTPLPNPNTLLTPPRTPQFESSHGNSKPLDQSPVSMVTACTNTGASLLLGTPVKPSGKRSAATSPMKQNEMNHSRRSLPSSSTETNQHISSESQKHDSTVNPEELANQVLELDDPSQTLASSLHAVDIPSFVESPSGVTSPSHLNQANRGGMETSFTSPVLGESASILMQQREKEGKSDNTDEDDIMEEESTGNKSNHVSLLQRNERQFYDNLLYQVRNILDQQVQDGSESSEVPSQENEEKAHVSMHEPTREEVVMATIRQLEKLKESTLGAGNMEASKSPFIARQRPLHRSASLSAIPDHPHINYLSFSVDETLDEVFSEADLKYLTDIQLEELQQISSQRKNNSRHRAVTFSVLQEGSGVLSRKGSVEKDHLCDSSSMTAMDYTWNNLSMATKEYLGKYFLAPTQPCDSGGGTGDWNSVRKLSDTSHGKAEPQASVASQACNAPPSTPEPAKGDDTDSQILDITRLKRLPKLF